MKPHRRQRFILIALLLICIGGAVGLTLRALQQNINLFFTPSQMREGPTPRGEFRLGGLVEAGSLARDTDALTVRFMLTDTRNSIAVQYTGLLPDLFREGQGIVATGKLREGVFIARQVLAKHDENYMPPAVQAALRAANDKSQ